MIGANLDDRDARRFQLAAETGPNAWPVCSPRSELAVGPASLMFVFTLAIMDRCHADHQIGPCTARDEHIECHAWTVVEEARLVAACPGAN